MPLIEIKNIEKTYPDGTRAIRGISFSVEEGEFVAVMGQSGSGKSTLLHILGFLDEPTNGKYHFSGKELGEYSFDEVAHTRNRKMGFVFQMFNLLSRATVLENVKLPLLYSDIKEELWDERAKEAIESVGLSNRIKHTSSQLSGGEKQRVAIARALVNRPQIIFADEPTGNLDSKSGGIIMNILCRLHKEGHTILLITHETYTAGHAQRIIRLYDGAVESDKAVTARHIEGNNFTK